MIRKNQKGFTLIELIFVLVILAMMMLLEMQKKQAEFDQMQARTLGVEIYQISNSVAKFTSYQSGNDDYSPEAQYTTLDFLKDADEDGSNGCTDGNASTPTLSFLDCNFLPENKTTFGKLGFKIKIEKVNSEDPVTGNTTTYLSSKIVFDKLTKKTSPGEREAKSLSGLAALVAAGATTVGSNDPSMLSTVATIGYCMSDSISYCDTDDVGHIVAVTSDDPSSQIWLRVDHGNTMQNILEFGSNVSAHDSDGFSLRQIQSVARIYNGEDAGGLNDSLILGSDGEVYNTDVLNPALPDAGVVVDADMLLYKKLAVLSDAAIKGNLTVDGNTDIGGNLTVDQDALIKQDAEVQGNLTTKGDSDLQGNTDVGKDLEVDGNTKLHGTLTVDLSSHMKSTLRVDNDVYAPKIYDSNDNNYYVDPNSESKLNTVIATTRAELPNNTYITVNGTKRLLTSLLPTYVHMYSSNVSNGTMVTKPSCATGGTPKIILTPIVTPIRAREGNQSGRPATGTAFSYARHSGNYWRVFLGAIPDSGASRSGARAVASVYCSYEVH